MSSPPRCRAFPAWPGCTRACSGRSAPTFPGAGSPASASRDGVTEVHVTLFFGAAVRETAARIRDVVAGVVGGTVNVTVEDVVAPTTTEIR